MSIFIKSFRKGILWRAEIWEKSWSEEMQSNVVKLIAVKKFLTKTQLEKWKEKSG